MPRNTGTHLQPRIGAPAAARQPLFPTAHHPTAFRDREKAFPNYADALAWEKQHLKKLLRR